MICFCYFCKKNCFLLCAWPLGTPFLHNLGQKMVIFRGFSKVFLELLNSNQIYQYQLNPLTYFTRNQAKKIKVGVALGQNLGQIRPNVVKKVKKWLLSIAFFSYFTLGIPFKAKNSGFTNI